LPGRQPFHLLDEGRRPLAELRASRLEPVAFLLVLLAGAAVAISTLLSRLSGYRDTAAVLGDAYGRPT